MPSSRARSRSRSLSSTVNQRDTRGCLEAHIRMLRKRLARLRGGTGSSDADVEIMIGRYKRRDELSFLKTGFSAFILFTDQSYCRRIHRARCNGLAAASLHPATHQLLSSTITVASYNSSDAPCVIAPPSLTGPLLDGEEYMTSFAQEDLKHK